MSAASMTAFASSFLPAGLGVTATLDASSAGAASMYHPEAMSHRSVVRSGFAYVAINMPANLPERPLSANLAVRFASPPGQAQSRRKKRCHGNLPEWGNTPSRYGKTIRFIVGEYLNNDKRNVLTSPSFLKPRYAVTPEWRPSGYELLSVAAKLECQIMNSHDAIAKLGGHANVIKIIKERYLSGLEDVMSWDSSFDTMRDTLRYVLNQYLQGDVQRVKYVEGFLKGKYVIESGELLSGRQLLGAVARVEWPELSARESINKYGMSRIAKIAREKYLAEDHDVQDWGSTPEKMRATLQFVAEEYLDGNIDMIRTTDPFLSKKYRLASGQEISGQQLLCAVAKLERTDLYPTIAFKEIGKGEVARIAREVYLSKSHREQDWRSTRERLRDTLLYVLSEHLDGDVDRLSASRSFMSHKFKLSSGQIVSGQQLLGAVAKLEYPDMGVVEALRKLGRAKASQIARTKYLSTPSINEEWKKSFDGLSQVLAYVVKKYLEGNVHKVTSGQFKYDKYTLPSGQSLTGQSLLDAVARLEWPELRNRRAYEIHGVAKIARIAREKYLSSIHEVQAWEGSYEKLSSTLTYIVKKYFNGDISRVNSRASFLRRKYVLPSGQRVSGHMVLRAVAGLEHPDSYAKATLNKIGYGQVARIAREKYLFSLDDTPESFVQAMRLIMGDEGEGDDQD